MLGSEGELEIGMSETALLRRRRAFIAGVILAFIGDIMIAVFFLYPYPALGYPLGIRLGLLGASLFCTGVASASGSLLVWPARGEIGYFLFRFQPLAHLFSFSVIAAGTFWCLFILFLDTVDRAIVGSVAGLVVVFIFARIRRKRLQKVESGAILTGSSNYGTNSVDSHERVPYR